MIETRSWIEPIVVLTADNSPKLDCLSLFATTQLLKRPVSVKRLVGCVAQLGFGDQWPFITGARRRNVAGILAGSIAHISSVCETAHRMSSLDHA